MKNDSKRRKLWPDFLRVIASFAVVMIHVHSWKFVDLNPPDKIGFMAIDLFCYWSVPVFVMLSGYLLLSPSSTHENESTFVFVKKRWARMIRPTLVWALLAFVWGGVARGQSAEELMKRAMTGTPNDPQWFLFMLLGLYFLTPWLRSSISNGDFHRRTLTGTITVLYLVNLFVIIQIWMGYTSEPIFPANSLFFLDIYLFGLIAGNRDSWSQRTDYVIWASAAILSVLLLSIAIMYPFLYGNIARKVFTNYHNPFILLQATAIFRWARRYFDESLDTDSQDGKPFRKVVRTLSDWSFGIYVIHPFVLSFLFNMVLRPIDGPFLPYCLVIWCLTMCICCIACHLLKKIPSLAWLIP